MKDLRKRYDNLIQRRQNPFRTDDIRLAEAINKSDRSTPLGYIAAAMEPVDDVSTEKMIEQGERIFNQLEDPLRDEGLPVSKEIQGSLCTDTHIKFFSDVDLLLLTKKYITVNPPLLAEPRYQGNPIDDLYRMRSAAAEIIDRRFHAADVDTSGAKSIKISGGSIYGSVDIVPSNWIDTQAYHHSGDLTDRLIHVFDSEKRRRIENSPFLHNKRINDRDVQVGGNLKKLIRFLKTVKADAGSENLKIEVSSYDIAGLAYVIPPTDLLVSFGNEIQLLETFIGRTLDLLENPSAKQSVLVPNGSRPIFCADGASDGEVIRLLNESNEILQMAKSALLRPGMRFDTVAKSIRDLRSSGA